MDKPKRILQFSHLWDHNTTQPPSFLDKRPVLSRLSVHQPSVLRLHATHEGTLVDVADDVCKTLNECGIVWRRRHTSDGKIKIDGSMGPDARFVVEITSTPPAQRIAVRVWRTTTVDNFSFREGYFPLLLRWVSPQSFTLSDEDPAEEEPAADEEPAEEVHERRAALRQRW